MYIGQAHFRFSQTCHKIEAIFNNFTILSRSESLVNLPKAKLICGPKFQPPNNRCLLQSRPIIVVLPLVSPFERTSTQQYFSTDVIIVYTCIIKHSSHRCTIAGGPQCSKLE